MAYNDQSEFPRGVFGQSVGTTAVDVGTPGRAVRVRFGGSVAVTSSTPRTVTFESSDGSTQYFEVFVADSAVVPIPPFYAAEGLRLRADGGSDSNVVFSYFQD